MIAVQNMELLTNKL